MLWYSRSGEIRDSPNMESDVESWANRRNKGEEIAVFKINFIHCGQISYIYNKHYHLRIFPL